MKGVRAGGGNVGARPQICHVTGAYDLVGLCLSWERRRALLASPAHIFLFWVFSTPLYTLVPSLLSLLGE